MFYSIHSITPLCRKLHAAGTKLVLATGFFDLLHSEHINFLTKARAVGDVLIVAVESDERARLLKGEGRPIETQKIRAEHLLPYCDYVIELGADFDNPAAFESLIAAVRPTVLAVSSHTLHQDKKQALVVKYGGSLKIVHDWNPSISTTKKLQ